MKKSLKLKKFPEQISVRVEPDTEEDYLLANPDLDMSKHVQANQKVKVAIYRLVEVREVCMMTSSKLIKQ